MTDTIITVIGNMVAAPELRFTAAGAPVANFTIPSTPRSFDKATNEWKDGEALFLRCSIWRDAAENVTESLEKGMRVIVQGNLKQRSYETREGEKRTSLELEVEEIGPALRYATAKVTRTPRGDQQSGQQSKFQRPSQKPADDPWGTPPQQQAFAPSDDGAPF